MRADEAGWGDELRVHRGGRDLQGLESLSTQAGPVTERLVCGVDGVDVTSTCGRSGRRDATRLRPRARPAPLDAAAARRLEAGQCVPQLAAGPATRVTLTRAVVAAALERPASSTQAGVLYVCGSAGLVRWQHAKESHM